MTERSADDIQRDIEKSRTALAETVDQLAYRTSPKRVMADVKQSLRERAQTRQGQAVIAVVGGLVVIVIIRRFRKR